MSFFSNLRADRLIEQIKSSTNLMGPETQKAIAKLKDAGPGAIDAVIAALALENGAILASTDQDFRRFPDLQWINPLRP